MMTADSLTMTSYSLTLIVLMVFSFVYPGAFQTVYTDSNCDDECPAMSSCMHTGENSYVCECEYGYEQLTPGAACEDKNECLTDDNDCGELGVCTNTVGGHSCECPPGYIYDDSNLYCTDIDECADVTLNNCEEGCENTIGSFTCECEGDKVLNADGRSCSNECLYEVHNCYGENPCNPLCESGVKKYRAKFQRRFIDCGNDGSCTEKKCGRSSIWDQNTEKCLRWGLEVPAKEARPIVGRCGANQNQHNCRANNPCAPTRCEANVYFYKGSANNKYVECLEDGTCIEKTCSRGQNFIAGSCQ